MILEAPATSSGSNSEPVPATPEGPDSHAGQETDNRRSPGGHPDDVRDFEAFYMQSRRSLLSAMRMMGATSDEAEDVVQETMIAIYSRWNRLQNPVAYAHQAARHTLQRLQSRQRRSQDLASLLAAGEDFPIQEPKVESADGIEGRIIVDLLSQLPLQQRNVVALVFDGYTTKEIANTLQINESSVRGHLLMARKRLRRAFGEIPDSKNLWTKAGPRSS